MAGRMHNEAVARTLTLTIADRHTLAVPCQAAFLQHTTARGGRS